MLTLAIPPDKASYTVDSSADVVETILDGGTSRRRADVDNATRSITVQWTTDNIGYDYLQAFYRQTYKGADAFFCDLINDSSDLQTYTCWFVSSSFKLLSIQGNSWVQVATLEIVPLLIDNDNDNLIIQNYTGD